MTTTADADELVHAVGFYGSDRQFLEMAVPFCEAGMAAGEPILVSLLPRQAELLAAALDGAHRIAFAAHDEQYPSPAGALQAVEEAWQRHAADHAGPLRFLGELRPPEGLARDSWVRYEAAVNHVLAGLSVRALCLYHTGGLAPAVRAELERTHPVAVTADGAHHPNPSYQPPEAFMAHRLQVVSDPVEAHPAAVDLTDPAVGTVRHTVIELAHAVGVDPAATDDLAIAVTEVTTNALVHGRPPVRVRAWAVHGRVVVTVGDAGAGPDDPLAGLRPPSPEAEAGNGFGLWIAHQLCSQIAMATTAEGFTVRLAATAATGPQPAPAGDRG